MQLIWYLMALLAGVALTLQAALNAKMGRAVASPVIAAMLSFVVGTLALLGYLLAQRTPLTQLRGAAQADYYVWLAGVLGAFYVASVVVLTPRFGPALTFGLVVAGQLGVSLLLEHFGWLGLPLHPLSWLRLAGLLLILTGIWLIRQ
jgi:bacterial/archaeal transporter family-2 protein